MSVLSKTVGSKVNAGLQLGFLMDNIAENTDLVSSVCTKNLGMDTKAAVENSGVLQGKTVQIQEGVVQNTGRIQGGAIGIPSKSIRDIVFFPCGTIPGSFYDFAGCSVLRCGGQLPLRYKFTQVLLNL